MDTTMKQFKPIDPLSIKSNPNLIGSLPGDTDPSDTYCLLVIDTHAIIFDYGLYTDPNTNESEWLTYQLEFPKAGLRWIVDTRSEEHTSELQSRPHLVCRLLLEKKKKQRQ